MYILLPDYLVMSDETIEIKYFLIKLDSLLQQFGIFNEWNTRFLNAKFLKAVKERENLRKSAKSAGNKNYSRLSEMVIKSDKTLNS